MISLVPPDLASVLEELGLQVGREAGLEVWATCPNPDHDDTRPTNYSVNRESGAGYCFACGYRHETLTTLVTRMLNLDGWTAARWLRDRGATTSVRLERIAERHEARRIGRVREQESVEERYSIESRYAVFTDPPDWALEERELTRDAAIEFDVRWNSERETFVLPVYSPRGKLLGWQERTKPVPKNQPYGLKKKQTLFGIEIFRGPTAILVESPLDAVRLWSEGLDGGLAAFGVEVSVEQMNLILDRAKKLVLALDDDKAGHKMTEELVKRYAIRIPTSVFYYGDSLAKDPGDMNTQEILRGIRKARFTTGVKRRRKVVYR